jgi:hypothetical protein
MHSDPRPDVVQLFIQPDTQTALSEAIAGEWPAYFVNDCNLILERFADSLWRYRRPVGDGQGFFRWATAWVKRETRRMRFLSELRSKFDELMFAAIVRALYLAPEDLAIEPEDHISNLLVHLLQYPRKIDALIEPRRGKQSSVLFGLIKSRTRGYRKKLRDRRKLMEERSRLYVEPTDPDENLRRKVKRIRLKRVFGVPEIATLREEVTAVSFSAAIREAEEKVSEVA